MKRKKETLLLALLIVALTLYLVVRRTGKTHYEIPQLSEMKKEEVSRLEVHKGKAGITLQKQDGRWVILPEGYPADGGLVDAMVNTLANLKLTALASEAQSFTLYDLEEAKRIEATAFSGDKTLIRLEIGKAAPSFRHTFVKLADDSRVFHAAENFRSRFDKDVPSLRDKQVMKVDDEISQILLAGGGKSLQVLRHFEPAPPPAAAEPGGAEGGQETGVGTQPPEAARAKPGTEAAQAKGADAGVAAKTPSGTGALEPQAETAPPAPVGPKWTTEDGKAVKEKELDGLVTVLSNLKCDAFVEGKKKEDFRDPSFTLSLKGARNYEFSVFEKQDGKFVCTSSESDFPFLIPEWRVKKIQLDLGSLVED